MRKSMRQLKNRVIVVAIAAGAMALVNTAYANQLGHDSMIDLQEILQFLVEVLGKG